MVVLSKAVWVQTFGFKAALFPYDNPALFSMTIAFVGIWLSRSSTSQRARAPSMALLRRAIRAVGDRHRRRLRAYATERRRAGPGHRPPASAAHAERLRRQQPALRPADAAGDQRAARRARHRLFPPGRGRSLERRPAAPRTCMSSSRARSRCATATTLNAVLGPKDSFDSRALVHGAAGEDFIAAEETLCYLIPRPHRPRPDRAQSGLRRLLLFRGLRASSTPSPAPTGRKAWRACCAPGCARPAAARPSSSTAMRRIGGGGQRCASATSMRCSSGTASASASSPA